jgi:Zn-dependent protease with chaperone function
MAQIDTIPYPCGPDPKDVPDDLTAFPPSCINQERLLLVCLFIVLACYLTAIPVVGLLTAYLIVLMVSGSILAIGGAFVTGLVFIFLIKGFFKRPRQAKEFQMEITEDEHPALFGFIRRVCEETGADEPRAVYVIPDVNAGVRMKTTFANLFVSPKKDLIIGLGLVNCLNLSEFKAVLAHEFGHFTQNGFLEAYTTVVGTIIWNMVNGEDGFDDMVRWCKNQGGVLTLFGLTVGGLLWLFRTGMNSVLNLIAFQRTNVVREGEFHADLVAARVAGSDAIVHGLLKSKFGAESLEFALHALRRAADHKLYTADLYFHQRAAADKIRQQNNDPQLGQPPKLTDQRGGKKIQVFNPQRDEDPAEEGDYHPSNSAREKNVMDRYIPAAIDERSPWLLFTDPAALSTRMTCLMYRTGLKVPEEAELADPRTVQKFIDDMNQRAVYAPCCASVSDEAKVRERAEPLDAEVAKVQP